MPAAILGRPVLKRLLLLGALCLATAFLLVGPSAVPEADLEPGQVAERTVRAPVTFEFVDAEATEVRRREAARQVLPVFDHDVAVTEQLQARLAEAFAAARRATAEALLEARAAGGEGIPPERERAIERAFADHLGVTLSPEVLRILAQNGFSQVIESIASDLLATAMRELVIVDRDLLPNPPRPIRLVQVGGGEPDSTALRNLGVLRTPEEVRNQVALLALERYQGQADAEVLRAATALAKALVRPNVSYDLKTTATAREEAVARVVPVVQTVPRGSVLVRQGDVVTARQAEMVRQVRELAEGRSLAVTLVALAGFALLLFGGLHRFAHHNVRKFARSLRELGALAALVVLSLVLARITVDLSPAIATLLGNGATPEVVWFLVPLAGTAMLVRILMNSETALVFLLVVSVLVGLLMEQDALYVATFALASAVGAGSIGRQQDRRIILMAGLRTGLVAAGFVLALQVAAGLLAETAASPRSMGWSALFAFLSGPLSAFLVLGLIPLFEQVGFVTDLQLLEMANLNHPLLRNLMLRAPGTYHHSVMVGQLSEAAAEAIGCNALQARVASYFHDIGKAVTPRYFVENQGGGPSPHARLSPATSARIIIDHVRNGGEIARRHKLPRPIVDNIYMHHGTGLLYYFYRKARELDPEVDEAAFRYPGPRPRTREAGIIHLADKVEAACRTIEEPTPQRVAAMIQRIINTTLADGQLEECPLTVQELYTIARVFKDVILAIHHQRIAYPDTADLSRTGGEGAGEVPEGEGRPGGGERQEEPAAREEGEGTVITLEIPAEELGLGERRARAPARPPANLDYESVDALPEEPLGPRWER